MSEIQRLGNKYIMARRNVMVIIAFTAINIVLLILNANISFLFSATMPQVFYLFSYWFYEASNAVIFLIFGIVLALVVLGIYLIGYIFSKKNYNWLTFVMIFFALDIAFLLYFIYLGGGLSVIADFLLDIAFHIYVIVTLIQGVVASSKLKKANVTIKEVFSPEFLRAPVQPITQNEKIEEIGETVETAEITEPEKNETEE